MNKAKAIVLKVERISAKTNFSEKAVETTPLEPLALEIDLPEECYREEGELVILERTGLGFIMANLQHYLVGKNEEEAKEEAKEEVEKEKKEESDSGSNEDY